MGRTAQPAECLDGTEKVTGSNLVLPTWADALRPAMNGLPPRERNAAPRQQRGEKGGAARDQSFAVGVTALGYTPKMHATQHNHLTRRQ